MTKEWIWAIVTGLSGILLGWLAHIKTARKDAVDAATHDTAIDTALKSDGTTSSAAWTISNSICGRRPARSRA